MKRLSEPSFTDVSKSRPSPKPWPVAGAAFVEVEIQHPRERQMHILFEDGPKLIIGDSGQIPLAAELISHLRKIERRQKEARS